MSIIPNHFNPASDNVPNDMNKYEILALKALRKLYAKVSAPKAEPYDRGVTDFDTASDMIYDLLAAGKPCMVARYGAFELSSVINYLGVLEEKHSVCNYIRGRQSDWWWNRRITERMRTNAGFFPTTESSLMKFGEMMARDSREVDILGSWLADEQVMKERYDLGFRKVTLLALEPYWAKNPWSRILEGKRVTVVHPFAPLIEKQYQNREKLFRDNRILPEFNLRTVQAVQSIGGICGYHDWFEALDAMKAQMDARPYDIALIGCGAYGFPLAAHAKRTGHQAVHLGGALQLFFGIRGKRWDSPDYGVREFGRQNVYKTLFNEAWVYPSDDLVPAGAGEVESACYWK